MTARANVEFDPISWAVRVAISPQDGAVMLWGPTTTASTEANVRLPDDAWLHLPEDTARALFEALADHFVHSTHDARALRRDYEAERKRVDLFIEQAVRTNR